MNQSSSRKKVVIYTDGACSGNPGPGGWGAVLLYKEHRKEISGGATHTTNQQMELMAAAESLKSLKQSCEVTLYSDSAYLVNAFTKGWIDRWQKNGWRNSQKEPVANREIWEKILQAMKPHKVSWKKVEAHGSNELNNRCDELARQAAKEFAQ